MVKGQMLIFCNGVDDRRFMVMVLLAMVVKVMMIPDEYGSIVDGCQGVDNGYGSVDDGY
jgi:hypothetical protein